MPHVGPARAALGAHPANNERHPPSRATTRSSASKPRRGDGPVTCAVFSGDISVPTPSSTALRDSPPAKSPRIGDWTSRICTRVFTTSNGVVAPATSPPATTPLTKLMANFSL
eukprot:CAMPEP_0119212346 /NCGR_PEP_ID=MMETSP1327-20130426/3961_1 /TAXON_ID=38833 /ORGANISM="Micromonas pusilla, Strain RCC2306" /LENGTH=112 /DNA_ID=CAMNT_0007209615 /DNA_START=305 /DNA_END=643 /DNA_ORIENTATION=+